MGLDTNPVCGNSEGNRFLARAVGAQDQSMLARDVTIIAHEVGTLGGMESQLKILAEGLLAAGIPITVITRWCGLTSHPLLTVYRVPTPRRPFPVGYPLFALFGSLLVRRHGSGIVHATGAIVIPKVDCITVHFCHAAYRDLGLGPRPGAPGRIRDLSARTSRRMAILAERWCYRRSRVRSVIAVSAGVQEEICRYFPDLRDRVETIPHGVDSARFKSEPGKRDAVRAAYGIGHDDLVAVFVGGDWKRKRLAHAIDAIARTDDWKLLVVGRGHRATYEQHARALDVADRVCFAGISADVPSHLAAGDVFLLPTEYETFCLVAFEAAAAGLPLLVSRVSGPDLLVEPGINGDFVDGDVSRTARLLRAYGDPVRRRAHGQAARTRVRRFTWQAAIDAHVALYRRLAGATHESSA